MIQGSDEWLALRCGKFTASRFSDLMARTKTGPSASRANLIALLAVERLTGKPAETYQNAAMARGTELEPEARIAYEQRIGTLVEESAFVVHPSLPYVGMSPDGMVGDDGLIEIKCPGAAKHIEALRRGAHAVDYRWQIQGQMWVSGRKWCDAVSYHPDFPEHLRLAITRVERDEIAIGELEKACIEAEAEVCAIVDELNNMEKS